MYSHIGVQRYCHSPVWYVQSHVVSSSTVTVRSGMYSNVVSSGTVTVRSGMYSHVVSSGTVTVRSGMYSHMWCPAVLSQSSLVCTVTCGVQQYCHSPVCTVTLVASGTVTVWYVQSHWCPAVLSQSGMYSHTGVQRYCHSSVWYVQSNVSSGTVIVRYVQSCGVQHLICGQGSSLK